MDVIKAGTLLIENGTLLPRSLVLASEPYSSGWTTVANLRSDFERDIKQAGLTFFFLSREIHGTVFGFNPETAVVTPLTRSLGISKSLTITLHGIVAVPYK